MNGKHNNWHVIARSGMQRSWGLGCHCERSEAIHQYREIASSQKKMLLAITLKYYLMLLD